MMMMMKAHVVLAAFMVMNVGSVSAAFEKPPIKGSEGEGGGTGGSNGDASTNVFLNGPLGALEGDVLNHLGSDDALVKAAAEDAVRSVLSGFLSAAGDEVVQATDHKITPDDDDNLHFRFRQFIKGHPIEGATMMMHVDGKTGEVYGFNGDFFPTPTIDTTVKLTCEDAVNKALALSGIQNGEWISECEEAAVRGSQDGLAHLAFKRLVGYEPTEEEGLPYQKTMVFASTVTGKPLALHPQIKGQRSLETWDCRRTWYACRIKSNSSDPISFGQFGVRDAHNFAINTYDFYKSEYNRDSIDDEGMEIVSFANKGTMNNAYWDGESVNYGGGDGKKYYPWSVADVVAHEITHGVTQSTSNLNYYGESGALNEAMSDIFGAVIDRLYQNKSVKDTWLVAEDVFINGSGAIRNMQDPAEYNNVDYYPDIIGDDYYYYYYANMHENENENENEKNVLMYEVHNFSAIGNLAFALMVQGGQHPRNKTNITVPAIDPISFDNSLKTAAKIFYFANTQCLTESSNYADAYQCTKNFAGEHEASVLAAWKAVGVTGDGGFTATQLQDGVKLSGQDATYLQSDEYVLEGVKAGEAVTCVTEGDNGDADLFVRSKSRAVKRLGSSSNDCSSGTDGSNEVCTSKVATKDTKAYSAVQAYDDYSDLSITCFRTPVKNISLGVVVTGQQGAAGVAKYYGLDLSDWYSWYDSLSDGDKFTCASYAPSGDTDLFFKFGTLPKPFDDETNDCESMTLGTSKESCTATYAYKGVDSYQAFAAVYSANAYQDVSIQCDEFVEPSTLYQDDYAYIYGSDFKVGKVLQYVMNDVKAGQAVTCSMYTESNTTTDANLYVRFGKEAEPYGWSTANACKSTGPTINETCTTLPSKNATSVYVAVATKAIEEPPDDDYYYYNNDYAILNCTTFTPCKAKAQKCTSKNQCCSKLCVNNKCQKKKKTLP